MSENTITEKEYILLLKRLCSNCKTASRLRRANAKRAREIAALTSNKLG